GAGLSRYELGMRAVERLAEGAGRDEEWSLIIADDAGTAAVARGFSTEHQSLIPVLESSAPWGTTSVDEMVVAGVRQFSEAAGGTKRFLLLVTDGINTQGKLYRLRTFDLDADLQITPVVLGFVIAEYPDYCFKVSDWITASNGTFLFADQTEELRSILDNGALPRLDRIPEGYEEAKETDLDEELSGAGPVMLPIWWLFLIPAAGTVGIMARRYRRWDAERRAAGSVKAESREVITLAYATHGGDVEKRTFEKFPVKVGGGKADLVLDKPRIGSGARSFRIVRGEDGFTFSASGMFIVNGVGRMTCALSSGDRITFGRYRVVFEGASRITTAPPAVPKPRFLFLFLPFFVFILLAVIFREPVALGVRRAGAQKSPSPAVTPLSFDHERSDHLGAAEADTGAGRGANSEAGHGAGGVTAAMEASGELSPSGLVFAAEPGEPDIDTFPTVMWKPGALPDYFKLDALFFHAHPDDESLDYGVLLRRLASAGKRTAVVLLTDGDSGLDQYPRRAVGEGYPPYRLQGPALAEVRAREATTAMSILGVNHYVRLGLENNPYGVSADVISVGAVMAAWGGEEALLETLSSLLRGYKPDIVVSPDGPAAPLEHFEHETVGLLVEAAVKKLEREGAYAPVGRLVCVDPRQKALCPDAVGVAATGIDDTCGLSYRAIQAAALAEHGTQRDASVVGVENLSGFDKEYYRVLSWNSPLSIEEYLESR
ncbi:MAG: PIG-L family deacetylase, partial [Spirochaetales bacterium]|nr:PIG-L family deacetylase [Spirochaetales bacterium]